MVGSHKYINIFNFYICIYIAAMKSYVRVCTPMLGCKTSKSLCVSIASTDTVKYCSSEEDAAHVGS